MKKIFYIMNKYHVDIEEFKIIEYIDGGQK